MSNTATLPTSDLADREIVISRLVHASRERVFNAWTDPDLVVQWWGPTGFTTTNHEMEVKPRGTWRYVMHGPDGTDYGNRIVYQEVVAPERLAYAHGSDIDNDPEQFQVTVTFEEEGASTLLTMQMLCATAEQRNQTIEFGAVDGGNQTLDRLETLLGTEV